MSSTTVVSRQAVVTSLPIWRVRKTVGSWVGFIPPVLAGVVIIAPVLWTVSTSLRTPAQSFTVPPQWLPLHPDWSNYRAVFATVPYGLYLLNSAVVAVCTVGGQLVTAALAGYAFARFTFPGKTVLFWLIMATMMIPLQATIIPVFVEISKLGLNDTLAALIVPALPTAFGTFLMRQYFLRLPNELEEAAVIDGANQGQVFWRVYLPLGVPGLAILAILTFNGTWNGYFRPLIFLASQQHYTWPVGIVTLYGYMSSGSISVVLAGVVLSVVVVLAVYVFGQCYLIAGLTVGGLKG